MSAAALCEECGTEPADFTCVDCTPSLALCKAHADAHPSVMARFRTHRIMTAASADRYTKASKCEAHGAEVKYFCVNTEKALCFDCVALGEHPMDGHKHLNLKQVMDLVKEEQPELLKRIQERALALQTSLDRIKEIEEKVSAAKDEGEKEIKRVYGKLRAALEVRERTLLSELDGAAGKRLSDLKVQISSVVRQLEEAKGLEEDLKIAVERQNDFMALSLRIAAKKLPTDAHRDSLQPIRCANLKYVISPEAEAAALEAVTTAGSLDDEDVSLWDIKLFGDGLTQMKQGLGEFFIELADKKGKPLLGRAATMSARAWLPGEKKSPVDLDFKVRPTMNAGQYYLRYKVVAPKSPEDEKLAEVTPKWVYPEQFVLEVLVGGVVQGKPHTISTLHLPLGKFVKKFEILGSSAPGFKDFLPYGMCLASTTDPLATSFGGGPADTELWVTDIGGHCVHKMTTRGKILQTFGKEGAKEGQFSFPLSVIEDPVGKHLYVADSQNGRVQVISTSTGSFVRQIKGLHFPSSVAIYNDEVFVVDRDESKVLVFSRLDGKKLREFGESGEELGQFKNPWRISIAHGEAFVLDRGNGRIQVFQASDGKFLRSFGSKGKEPGQFFYGNALFVSAEERLIVTAEDSTDRIQVWTLDGVPKKMWGGSGAADGKLFSPSGVTFDREGAVLVADTSHHRVQVFQ